ncbi:MAG TPA: phosphatidylglycerol lysyltransferase domain-containing protein [Thermomicrobiales bacterium]
MTPAFPRFARLRREHERLVRRLTSAMPPYSDALFSNLYAWNTTESAEISVLHGNLVVRMTDYETDAPLVMLAGTQRVERTVERLLCHAIAEGLPPALHLVPEATVRAAPNLERSFRVTADLAAYDYVYRAEEMAALRGGEYQDLRARIRRFRRFGPAELRRVELGDRAAQALLLDLFDRWAAQKGVEAERATAKERAALVRYLSLAGDPRHLGLVLYDGEGQPRAFAIVEMLGRGLANGHFAKGDREAPGSGDALRQHVAAYLREQGVRYLNAEQDLGRTGLRTAKQAWRPSLYLRKFTIRP